MGFLRCSPRSVFLHLLCTYKGFLVQLAPAARGGKSRLLRRTDRQTDRQTESTEFRRPGKKNTLHFIKGKAWQMVANLKIGQIAAAHHRSQRLLCRCFSKHSSCFCSPAHPDLSSEHHTDKQPRDHSQSSAAFAGYSRRVFVSAEKRPALPAWTPALSLRWL